MEQGRQGDVLIERVEGVPEGAKKCVPTNGRHIVMEGEATGHAHAVPAEAVEMYEKNGVLYLSVAEDTELTHEEHSRTPLFAGETYKIGRQQEYHPEEIRNVLD